jgi:hypothetical protein
VYDPRLAVWHVETRRQIIANSPILPAPSRVASLAQRRIPMCPFSFQPCGYQSFSKFVRALRAFQKPKEVYERGGSRIRRTSVRWAEP